MTNKQLFDSLLEKWLAETSIISSTTQIREHPACQKLIAMGPEIIPLLLLEIPKERGHMDLVLRGIVGERGPVIPKEQWGHIPSINKAWLDWGKETDLNGLIKEFKMNKALK